MQQLEDLQIAEDDRVRVQPCLSPVWDTAIATIALADAGLPAEHPAWARAVNWLLDKEVRGPGDWAISGPRVEPTGWHFQFRNKFYPDLDDSAMVVLALRRSPLADDPAVEAATRRGVDWLLSMQNRDGGWAAYDVDIDNQVLTKLPFADHNAMLDPSCADITARVLELLGTAGLSRRPPVHRPRPRLPLGHPGAGGLLVWPLGGQLHLRHLAGLAGAGAPSTSRWTIRGSVRAVAWLESTQQPSGAWGETCQSYDDPALKGTGEPTPSQTAWATLGPRRRRPGPRTAAVRRGIDYLIGSPAARRLLGRGAIHRHRIPPRVLSPVPLLSRVFPAHGHRTLQGGHRARALGQTSPALASRIPAQPLPLDS